MNFLVGGYDHKLLACRKKLGETYAVGIGELFAFNERRRVVDHQLIGAVDHTEQARGCLLGEEFSEYLTNPCTGREAVDRGALGPVFNQREVAECRGAGRGRGSKKAARWGTSATTPRR